MKTIYFLSALIFAGASVSYAGQTPIEYNAVCKGRGFSLKPVTIEWTGSFTGGTVDNIDAGQTIFRAIEDTSGKVLLNLAGSKQKFFRQTEAGISFFGIYNNANFTAENQTVYIFMAYQSITSIYEFMSKIKAGVDLSESLNGTEFMFQALAEEDPNSTLSLQFKCNFKVK